MALVSVIWSSKVSHCTSPNRESNNDRSPAASCLLSLIFSFIGLSSFTPISSLGTISSMPSLSNCDHSTARLMSFRSAA
ncbi:hypothetical protein D3C84_1078230 [compost metagenome]